LALFFDELLELPLKILSAIKIMIINDKELCKEEVKLGSWSRFDGRRKPDPVFCHNLIKNTEVRRPPAIIFFPFWLPTF
jgi:hypothetical protein